MNKPKQKVRGGVKSVEIASRLLRAIAESPQAQPLKNISARTSITPSKAHRYLVSLARAELVKQDPETGLYDIGPLALQLGLMALGRVNAVKLASGILSRLRDEIDETVMLSVWGNRGPTVVRLEESTQTVSMNARVGSVLPVATTATGRVFLAFLPASATHQILQSSIESDASTDGPKARIKISAAVLEKIRMRSMARDIGQYLSGVSALAAPIFDSQGQVAGVITVLGREKSFDGDWNGRPARALRDATELVSRQLGYIGRRS
jgi:DNA-binding IclR family transcriptional regulator